MKRKITNIVLAVIALVFISALPKSAFAQTIINCPSGFTSTGSCGTATSGGQNFLLLGPGLVGTEAELSATGTVHSTGVMNYKTPVNEQAFSTTFTFVPNGMNFAFVFQNNTNSDASGGSGQAFAAGAGGEAGFYQGFTANSLPVNNIFALEFDSYYGPPTNGTFSYSSVQIYQQGQNPGPTFSNGSYPNYLTNKVSTSPVPLNSPASTQNTTTGDTYSVTLNYTGTNLIMNVYDVTAGGSCPGASCFSYTWNYVYIPSLVGATTAYVGFTSATGVASSYPLYLNSFVYNVLSAASTPTFSPAAGDYGSTQSVTISASTGPTICWNTTGAPATNGTTGCTNGTLYSGAISVPSGLTIYAVSGGTGYGDSPVASSAYQIASTASQPTFSASSGTYQGDQYVILNAAQGGVICYNTSGSPATNGSTGCTTGTHYTTPVTVSSNETLYAIAGGTGFTDSAVSSSTYVINPYAGQAPVNAPQYSPVPGAYSGTQSVTFTDSTTGSYICYNVASSPPALFAQTDNIGGCLVGTLYAAKQPGLGRDRTDPLCDGRHQHKLQRLHTGSAEYLGDRAIQRSGCDGYGDCNRHRNSNRYGDCNGNSNAHCDCDRDSNSNGYRYTDSNGDGYSDCYLSSNSSSVLHKQCYCK